jgi:hypothetical protein
MTASSQWVNHEYDEHDGVDGRAGVPRRMLSWIEPDSLKGCFEEAPPAGLARNSRSRRRHHHGDRRLADRLFLFAGPHANPESSPTS